MKMFSWFDKFWTCGDALFRQQMRGKWFVLYEDNLQSQNFDYRTAKDYAEIFGGEVHHIKDRENFREEKIG